MGKQSASVLVEQAAGNCSGIYRSYLSPNKIVDGNDAEVPTVWALMERSNRLFPNHNALGWRDLIKEHDEVKEITKTVKGKEIKDKKTWKYFEMSDFKYMTYREMYDDVCAIGSALHALGVEKGKNWNIYATTSHNWQIFAQACARQSVTFATAYDSLGEEGLEHSLNEPEVVGMFTNHNLLPTLAKVISKCNTVKTVVYDGKIGSKEQAALDTIKSAHDGSITVMTLDEFKALGREKAHPAIPPTENDTCCIMYTSGSTGAPKGVVLSHRNVCSSVAACKILLINLLTSDMTFLAFLPLAHIFEFVVELVMLYHCITIGYGSIKTLTELSMRNCDGDFKTFKPTIIVGVPAVFETVRKGILGKVKEGGKERIFNAAMTVKRNSSILGHVADAVVFSKIKVATGGRLRFAFSGGAALSSSTQDFLQTSLTQMLVGYGMTETSAMCAIMTPEYYGPNRCGVPMACSEIKLQDCPDLNYSSKSNPPQGEILLRGASITSGYYKREDLTKETFTDDGWFMTGDIGQFNPDGTLSIIDRKKNLVKLSGGEYIAVEKLETVYSSCNLVGKICLITNPDASKPMAIVWPHEKNLRAAIKSQGHGDNEDFKSLCEDDQVIDTVLKELNNIGKKNNFKGLEMLQAVVLDPEEWTPHNNMLTAAQKLKRKEIYTKHKAVVDKIYP